jgi:membrane-associated phospholipid phosphatase
VLLLLMSFARIYAGQHWASDVLAGGLLGALWLAVTIRLYVWCEARILSRRRNAGPAPREKLAGPGLRLASDGVE